MLFPVVWDPTSLRGLLPMGPGQAGLMGAGRPSRVSCPVMEPGRLRRLYSSPGEAGQKETEASGAQTCLVHDRPRTMNFVRMNSLNIHSNRYYHDLHFIGEETKSWKVALHS